MTAGSFTLDGTLGPIRGEAAVPANARGAVVLVHGFKGFFRWGFFPHLARELQRARFATVVYNASGSGVGPDLEDFTTPELFGRNTFKRELADLDTVIAHATAQRWLPERYGIFGHSRGGGDAILHTASHPRVAALVTWASISTVMRWNEPERAKWRADGTTPIVNSRTGQVIQLGTEVLEEAERLGASELDISAAASRIHVPWLLVHGTTDDSVKFSEAERLRAAADPAALSFLEIPKGDHGFGAKHPLVTTTPELDQATLATVAFFERAIG